MQYLILIVASVALAVAAAPALAQSDFATIEYIAAFKTGSAEEELTRKAVQDPVQQARLAEHLQTMAMNAPIQFTGFVSGGSIRFAIDTEEVVTRLAENLAENNDIRSVRINSKARISEARYSGEAEIIASLQSGRATTGLMPCLENQSQKFGIPIHSEIKDNKLHVWVLWQDLSVNLIERMKNREEIDYVEQNAMLLPTPRRN